MPEKLSKVTSVSAKSDERLPQTTKKEDLSCSFTLLSSSLRRASSPPVEVQIGPNGEPKKLRIKVRYRFPTQSWDRSRGHLLAFRMAHGLTLRYHTAQ
ncbi:hypothetical protein E2C01_029310 [Portunus trituberculatus]|uniref:Uncharacterized protein n=1 Tax=Portunus trituberculatus TaxID=210409 RepID=A0A5B7ESJ3_PORTR|nr:hypothetical protein [Portunus trituberculatus]